jgi:hypothetical protein
MTLFALLLAFRLTLGAIDRYRGIPPKSTSQKAQNSREFQHFTTV